MTLLLYRWWDNRWLYRGEKIVRGHKRLFVKVLLLFHERGRTLNVDVPID